MLARGVSRGTPQPKESVLSTRKFHFVPRETFIERWFFSAQKRKIPGKHWWMLDGPRNGPVEILFYVLGPLVYYSYIIDFPSSFSQEDALALMGFDKPDRAVRSENGHGNSGKTSPGPNICDPKRTGWQMLSKEEGLGVMPLDDFRGVSDAGQIQDFVPANKQLVVPL